MQTAVLEECWPQVLMSGDNATLSCFQIIFWLGNLVLESVLKRSRPLKLQLSSVMAGMEISEYCKQDPEPLGNEMERNGSLNHSKKTESHQKRINSNKERD